MIQVKRSLERDPRYDAVGSSSLREELFLTHTRHLASNTQHVPSSTSTRAAPSDSTSATKKERAEASLKEREEKVRAQQGKVQMDIGRSRGLVGREEAEREFGSLLIDKVLEHDVCPISLLLLLVDDCHIVGLNLLPYCVRRPGRNSYPSSPAILVLNIPLSLSRQSISYFPITLRPSTRNVFPLFTLSFLLTRLPSKLPSLLSNLSSTTTLSSQLVFGSPPPNSRTSTHDGRA